MFICFHYGYCSLLIANVKYFKRRSEIIVKELPIMRKPHFVKLDKILTLHNDLFEKSKAQMHRIMDVLVI
jgi:hypothetical protein